MRSFATVFLFIGCSLAAEWADSGIKLNTLQQACYADTELYNIMRVGSSTYASCQTGRGNYPTGGTMGKAFCLFDKLDFFADNEKMKLNWDKVGQAFGSYKNYVDQCKDTDYDTDGGFWDNVGDWWGGEDFDYSSVDRAVGNFYNCIQVKLVKTAEDQFKAQFAESCPV